jgi:RimJ/RimL family protein N-acetyltransferase
LRRPARDLWSQLKELEGKFTQPLAVVLKASGEFVGQSGFLQSSRCPEEAELYCILRPKHWGNGFAPEVCQVLADIAFDQLKLKRLVAIVDPENAASFKLVERLGFKQCGSYDCPVRGWQHGHTILALSR